MIGFNVSWLSEKKKEKISYYAFSLSAIFVSVKFFFCSPILKKKKKNHMHTQNFVYTQMEVKFYFRIMNKWLSSPFLMV